MKFDSTVIKENQTIPDSGESINYFYRRQNLNISVQF